MMNTFKRPWVIGVLAVIFWMALSAVLAPRFPTPFIDEAENANHAWNLAYHHESVFSLYDQIYPPSLYFMRHAWPVVIRPFFVYPLAASFLAFGFNFVHARLFDSAVGALSLFLIYELGTSLGGRRAGLLAVALLSTRFAFLYTTHMIRPEALLCATSLLVWTALLKGLSGGRPLWFLFGGFLAGAAAGIHTNGILLSLPFFGVLVIERQWRAAAIGALGTTVGLTCFVLCADWNQFLPGLHSLFLQEFTTPPIERFHLNPLATINAELDRYYGIWILGLWPHGDRFRELLGWQMMIYVAAWSWATTQVREIKRFAWAGLFLSLGYALFVAQKAYNYTTVIEPLALLPLAVWLTREPLERRLVARGFIAALLLLPVGGFPLSLTLGFAFAQKRVAQIALLVFLICIASQITSVPSWMATLRQDAAGRWLWIGLWMLLMVVGHFYRPAPVASFRSWIAGALVATTLGTVFFVGGIWRTQPTFGQICGALGASMTPGARVAGPQTLWLGLSSFDYHDIGGLTWFHLLLGEKNLLRQLEVLHPRYMILDSLTANRLQRSMHDPATPLQGPTGLFPWPHRVVGVLPTAASYGGELVLVENLWPDSAGAAHLVKPK